jgi:flagellar protein FlaG
MPKSCILKGRYIMTSEVSSASSSPPAAAAFAAKPWEPKAGSAPKVMENKPIELQFDPAKAQQNLKSAVSMLNEQMAANKQGLGFSFDQAINGPVIKVSNIHTGEVVRQIPTEDVLRMAHKIDDLKGILYNKVV